MPKSSNGRYLRIIMQNSNKKEHPTDADALFLWKVLSAGEPLTNTLFSGLVFPVLSSLTDVSLVAELGHLLSLGEEFLGLVGISLLD